MGLGRQDLRLVFYGHVKRCALISDIDKGGLKMLDITNNNNNKLYLHDYNKELQYCKSHFNLIINYLIN